MENKCSICPHEANLDRFPPVDLSTAPYAHLRCGHQVHTHCLAIFLDRQYGQNFRCEECNQSLYTNEEMEWFRRGAQDNDINKVEKLWKSNEMFREHVVKLAKLQRRANALRNSLTSEYNELKKEWKTLTRPSIVYLKDQRKRFKKLYTNLPSRRITSAIEGLISRERRMILETYNMNRFELSLLHRIEGAPKTKINIRRNFRRFGLFRVVI